jgi:hypothetical protein
LFEKYNITSVPSLGEVEGLIKDIIFEMRDSQSDEVSKVSKVSKVEILAKQMLRFCRDWRMIFRALVMKNKACRNILILLKNTKITLLHMPFDV